MSKNDKLDTNLVFFSAFSKSPLVKFFNSFFERISFNLRDFYYFYSYKKKIIVRKKKEVSGLKKIASFTSQSIKSAYEGYKKSQKVK